MIAINGKIFTQRMSGLGRFAYEVVKRMVDASVDLTIITPNKPLHSNYEMLTKFVMRDKSPLHPFLWEVFRLGRIVMPNKFAALWSPANIGPINPIVPHFVTLHDLTFIHNPEWMNYKGRLIYRTLIPLICKRARAVIADSDFVRQELIKYLPFKKSSDIYMTYLGVDHVVPKPVVFTRFDLPKKYFMFIGNIDKRKNLDNIIHAWQIACAKLNGAINLFIVGEIKYREKFHLDLNDDSVQLLTGLLDEELFYLLSKSLGLIFPSLYEGFGLPTIEAMRCGCPVITSNIGTMAEIAGDAALLVDPHSVMDIADAIIKLAGSDSLHAELVNRGNVHQGVFTWDKTAEFYIELFPN